MLAGGLPSPQYFPFESISAAVLAPTTFQTTSSDENTWWSTLFGAAAKKPTSVIHIPKYAKGPIDPARTVQLSTALQYTQATGLPSLQSFIRVFTARVFTPGTADWVTTMHTGSTAAWAQICTTLCEPGDGVLCEAFTYPSALSTAWPSGIKPVPCAMDGQGLTGAGLIDVLNNWDVDARGGMRRPTLLYTIPVCQNPSGATMSRERKQEIYDICVKYDVVICEDDPYYFLQAGPYTRQAARASVEAVESDDEFLASLVPSFLAYDKLGYVVRIDTFSKTICPGSRLGWITSNPLFGERLLRAFESNYQAPW